MQFKEGTTVFTLDGKEVGDIDRVVIDPKTKEITHVVVRRGLLFGEDKVISVDLIDIATEDHVMLRDNADELPDLPHFEEIHVVRLSEQEEAELAYQAEYARPLYWYPPVGATWWGYPYPGFPDQPYVAETERNIPEGSIPLQEGARVISEDGERVGDVERVFTDPEGTQATHFLISQGLLLKEKKLVPMAWVDTIGEEQIELSVGSQLLEELPEYLE